MANYIERWDKLTGAIRETWGADSLRGRFARGAGWSFVGALMSQSSNLLAVIITARLLGRETFGEFGIIQSTVGMLGLFAGFGLGVMATKYVAEFRTRDPGRAGNIIALSTVVAVASGGLLAVTLIVCAPLLASRTLNAPQLALELRTASVLLFFNALNGSQTGALTGFEAFRTTARINLWRGLLSLPLSIALTLVWKLPGSVWALSATAVVTCMLSQAALRRECEALGIQPRLRGAWKESRILWRFAVPVVLTAASTGPAMWAADTMLVNQPRGYAEMALFSAASQWKNAILFVPLVLSQFALPLLSNLSGESDMSSYKKALKWHLLLTAGVSTAVAAPIALVSPFIMSFYGHSFRAGWLVLVLSSATAVVACLNGVVGTSLLSVGSVWANCVFNAMWAVVFLAASRFLVPRHLALGLTLSLFLAYVAHLGWQSLYFNHSLKRLGHVSANPDDLLVKTLPTINAQIPPQPTLASIEDK